MTWRPGDEDWVLIDIGLAVDWRQIGIILINRIDINLALDRTNPLWSGQGDQMYHFQVWSTRQMVTKLLDMRNGPISSFWQVSQSLGIFEIVSRLNPAWDSHRKKRRTKASTTYPTPRIALFVCCRKCMYVYVYIYDLNIIANVRCGHDDNCHHHLSDFNDFWVEMLYIHWGFSVLVVTW